MYEFLDYRVQDVMSRPFTVRSGASLASVEKTLESRGFNGLPVVDGDQRLVGWVTSLDLLRAFDFAEDEILPSFERVMEGSVDSVMQRDVMSVCPRTPLTRVLAKIIDTRNRSFPVVDGDHVVGVVARVDVMHALRTGTSGQRPWSAGDPEGGT